MKRYICLFLSFLCFFSCFKVAVADQYKIHNDVSFDDSINDIIEKEKSAGIELEELDQQKIIICPKHKIFYKTDIKLAGYDNADIYYHFDSNDKLVSCVYSLGSSKVKEESTSKYNSVNSLLMTKYGESDDLLNTVIFNGYLDLCVNHQQDDAINGLKGLASIKTIDSSCYSIKQDNGDIVIVYLCLREFNFVGIMLYPLYINYSIIDENTYNSTINSYNSEGQKAFDDL